MTWKYAMSWEREQMPRVICSISRWRTTVSIPLSGWWNREAFPFPFIYLLVLVVLGPHCYKESLADATVCSFALMQSEKVWWFQSDRTLSFKGYREMLCCFCLVVSKSDGGRKRGEDGEVYMNKVPLPCSDYLGCRKMLESGHALIKACTCPGGSSPKRIPLGTGSTQPELCDK